MARFGKRGADAESHEESGLDPELQLEPEADAGPKAGAEATAITVPDVPVPDVPVPDVPVPDVPVPAVTTSVVFHPEPLEDDAEEALGVVKIGPVADPALATAVEQEWTIVARTAPAANATRTALQEKMAEIAKKHKNGPIEDMTAPIRAALAAHGREVPDDWILAIAEGLRQHGPISLNLGGTDSVAS